MTASWCRIAPFALTQCDTSTLVPGSPFDLVARQYFLPNMKQLVAEFIRVCTTCQHVKHDLRGEQGLQKPLPIHTWKWQSICMDWVLGFHEVTQNGKTLHAVLNVTNRATRMVYFISSCKIESAEDTADLMFWNSFRLHDLPRSIISDRDPRL